MEVALSVESVSNFRRDGSRPTAFDVQALITNHFVLLSWKHVGGERQLKAFRKVGKVAEQGDAFAQYNVGSMYENGYGVNQSKEEALKWYRKAWGQGDEDAKAAVKRLNAE